MKIYKYIIIIILLNLFLILLNANEKPVAEDDNFEDALNNEIDPQFCFSFKMDKHINSKNNSLMTREDFFRKARGFLFMGITGIIFIALSIPVSTTLTILFWYIAPEFAFRLYLLLPIILFLPLVAIGIPLLITGFYYHNFYKKGKIPNPFTNTNNNNEIVLFKFNLMRQGA